MKRLAIIGSAGIPSNYGGFETLTENLVRQLSNEYEITVYCSGKHYPKNKRQRTFLGARLYYLPFNANGIQSIIYDYLSILRALFFSDTLLILGVSGCTLLPFVRLFTRKKIIVNIDGLEWKRKKWNRAARWFLHLSERLAVKLSHAHIADNRAIQHYVALYYGKVSQVIEYGGDHARLVHKGQNKANHYSFEEQPYCFKVARIEPENNIEIILDAFTMLEQQLVIIGNWENSAYGKGLREAYKMFDHIHLLDPIYDPEILGRLRGNAFIYLHGHEAGGTNPSLVEAMWLGLPIIAFDVSFNKETTEHRAHYFKTSADLQQLILTTPLATIRSTGKEMREIAKRRYQWSVIAAKYNGLIRGVQNGTVESTDTNALSIALKNQLLGNRFEELIRNHRHTLKPLNHE